MEPIQTLYELDFQPDQSVPASLATLYGGPLALRNAGPGGRPYVVANFVETLDSVVSFAEPGHAGGGDISGNSEPDRFIMGLLRARADAVVFGSGTLHDDSGHVRTAQYIYPDAALAFAEMRLQFGHSSPHPLNVVVTATGNVDLEEPTFHTPGLRALIATTSAGHQRLARQILPTGVEELVIPAAGAAEGVDPAGLLARLAADYDVRLVLHEGGPNLFAAFLADRLVDELFLTLAPQLAGRTAGISRPALIEGHAFGPGSAPWADLVSVKRSGAHLFLRYRFKDKR